MTPHLLDRPVWNALRTRHAEFAEGGPLALRFQPGHIPFLAAGDEGRESLQAMHALVRAGEWLAVVQLDPIVVPPGLTARLAAQVVQMVAEKDIAPLSDPRIERLTDADAPEMLALADLTKPGPFSRRSISLGEFWGIRRDGKLIAMAGERFKYPGICELSGVCSHPDARGQGLGRLLSVFQAARIMARGETPFLHAFTTNKAAITLYESIGFRLRATLNVAMVERPAA